MVAELFSNVCDMLMKGEFVMSFLKCGILMCCIVLVGAVASASVKPSEEGISVRVLTPEEAATYVGGTVVTGCCDSDSVRTNCEGPAPPANVPCKDRANEAVCTGTYYKQYWPTPRQCDGFPNGPKTCYNSGKQDCYDYDNCVWYEGMFGDYCKISGQLPGGTHQEYDDSCN
jgi:hypothetical protein